MGIEAGIILAIVAMIGWGFGDFFIQKSVRKFDNWQPLFIITLFGAIVLLPFVWSDIPSLIGNINSLWIVLVASVILFVAAVLDFEALKRGKLDVVEPIWSLEIPISALLAFFVVRESVGLWQLLLIASLIIGLVLVSVKSLKFSSRVLLEKGVIIAVIAALVMGVANFFVGWGARASDALMMNFVLNVVVAIFSLIFIIYQRNTRKMLNNLKKDKLLWLGMCIFDNVAWIAFAFAMVLAPIAVTVALSDSYIIIAVLLGMFVNKEKLHKHQYIGLVVALASAIVLAVITS